MNSHGFTLAAQPPFPVPAAAGYSDAALAASAGPFPGVRAERDIAWGPQPWQRFDIFSPAGAPAKKRPVLVFFHGGGWQNGYKEWCGFMAPAVAALGGVLVASTYRLAPEHRFPAAVLDCLAALKAACAAVPQHGGDPERLFVAGHSAGGHLAAMTALRPDLVDGVQPIKAVLPVSGILDLRHPDPRPGSLEAMVYERVLARPRDDTEASPACWADRARVPFILSWGQNDTDRVRASNRLMAERLAAAGAPHETHIFPGLDHFATHLVLRDPAHPWYATLGRLMETL
jgi:acetyl esterase/lipase